MPHDPQTTCFYLVRHASTDALGNTLSGRGPIPLNAHGRTEAAALATHFACKPITAIHSSPQPRTLQTARAIAQPLALPVHPEPALDEVDFGPWTGQTFANLQTRPDWRLWNTNRSLAPAPATETMLQAQSRAFSLLPRLHAATPGAVIILVTHADILKSILAATLGIPIDLMQRLEIAPASHSRVLFNSAGATVDCTNRRA